MKPGIIIWVLLIIVSAAVIMYNRTMHKKIAENGITVKGRISRIDERYDDDSGNTSYTWYVKYPDENGNEKEALLRGAKGLGVDDEVIIRYHPSNYAYAEYIETDRTSS